MNADSIITKLHAALVGLESGVGVAVQAEPLRPCHACVLEVWEGRAWLDGELFAYAMAPVAQLPVPAGVAPHYVLATVSPVWDRAGIPVLMWGPDSLPVADAAHVEFALDQLRGRDAMSELWRRLEAPVHELDRANV